MREATRLQLKQPSGWFAAGREVACALQLLSDATVKLFLWLCLHAERSRGTLAATPAELARALGKKETDIHLALQELQREGVCVLEADDVIQISDRFWPYRHRWEHSPRNESQRYVEEVKRLFLQRRCVQSSFTAADEKLALSLYRQGISLLRVERAILRGAVRKYATVLEHGRGTPISSLHYFTHLFAEVQQETSIQYWTYIARKVKTLEQAWGIGSRQKGLPTSERPEEGQKGGAVGRPS